MSKYTKEQHLADLEYSLKNASKSGLKMEVEIIGTHCCQECEKIDKLVIPFDEVLANPPLPYRKCTRKLFCICCYEFHALRDNNGRLIRKDSI